MTENEEQGTDALRAAAGRRVELKEALSAAEIAAAAPSAEPGWHDRLIEELQSLRLALSQHIEEVEAEDGLLSELTQLAPRLANEIGSVRDEHPDLCRRVEQSLAQAKLGADPAEVRLEVVGALAALAHHRQRGADLVYNGYNVDIGGS